MRAPGNEYARQAGGADRAQGKAALVSGARNAIVLSVAPDASTFADVFERWLPDPNTCAGRVLYELVCRARSGVGRGLSPQTFYREAWSQRLAAYVYRLRKGGWPIETRLYEATNRYERVRFAAYALYSEDEEAVTSQRLTDWMQAAEASV